MNELPYATDLRRCVPGLIKQEMADFQVEEIPLYLPSQSGDHLFVTFTKTGLTTQEAVDRLCRKLGVNPRDAGVAGQKDKFAITTQTISLEHVPRSKVARLDVAGIEINGLSLHGNKLKMGHLAGNRFVVKMRQTDVARVGDVTWVLKTLERKGVPNYFGAQRFGLDGDTWQKGRALVRGETDDGVKGGKRQLKFFVSAYQSYLFNRVLAQRVLADEYGVVKAGDVAWKHVNGACFTVEDAAAEQSRADAGEISPTGPLYGKKMKWPAGAEMALERDILEDEGVTASDFSRRAPWKAPGGRRPLRFFIEAGQVEAGKDDRGEYISLSFVLPAGCYATAVMREICK